MTIIWLIVWLIQNHPSFQLSMNPWMISLVVCLILDFFGVLKIKNH